MFHSTSKVTPTDMKMHENNHIPVSADCFGCVTVRCDYNVHQNTRHKNLTCVQRETWEETNCCDGCMGWWRYGSVNKTQVEWILYLCIFLPVNRMKGSNYQTP